MSRRGRSGPTISLFSFQDIITSVTAIVTVITLLLALDLVQKKQSRSNGSASALASDFVERLESAETQLKQLQSSASSVDDLVQEVASTSPAELRNEIAEREAAISDLEREKARLEKRFESWKNREREKLSEQFDLDPIKLEIVELDRTTTELERTRVEENGEKRTIFALPRGFRKEGWIAEINPNQITVAPIGRPSKPVTLVADALPIIGTTACSRFESWINDNRMTSAYFLVLIRPGADAEIQTVEEMLIRNQISHGYDVVDAEKTLFHPERGAAP